MSDKENYARCLRDRLFAPCNRVKKGKDEQGRAERSSKTRLTDGRTVTDRNDVGSQGDQSRRRAGGPQLSPKKSGC